MKNKTNNWKGGNGKLLAAYLKAQKLQRVIPKAFSLSCSLTHNSSGIANEFETFWNVQVRFPASPVIDDSTGRRLIYQN